MLDFGLSFPLSLIEDFRMSLGIWFIFVNFSSFVNIPRLGSQSKYRTPWTLPLFFPTGSSRATPAQSPLAKRVSPINAITPAFAFPTKTRSPILNKLRKFDLDESDAAWLSAVLDASPRLLTVGCVKSVFDELPRKLELELSLLYCSLVWEFSLEGNRGCAICPPATEPRGLTKRSRLLLALSLPFSVACDPLLTGPVVVWLSFPPEGLVLGCTVDVVCWAELAAAPRGLTEGVWPVLPGPPPPWIGFTTLLGVFKREIPEGIWLMIKVD